MRRSHWHVRITRRYQFYYTLNDFVAGVLFVIGSALFFRESTQYTATWMFLVGSVLFTVRPFINMLRNIHLQSLPDDSDVQSEKNNQG